MTFPARLSAAVPSLTPEEVQEVTDALPLCVPDLVWITSDRSAYYHSARSICGGKYAIGERQRITWWHTGTYGLDMAETLEAAKAAANAHHRRAVIAALMGEV